MAAYRVAVENPKGVLSFPLKGKSPYTAEISAVFDHSMPGGCADGIVVAFTGERGEAVIARSQWSTPSESDSCKPDTLYGFAKAPLDLNQTFVINGNYTGGSMAGPDKENTPYFLFYDGHTGYDYPCVDGTSVFTAADGVVIAVTNSGDPRQNQVTIQHADGYTTHYLHCSSISVPVGRQVFEGRTELGKTGLGHLHFTVKCNGDRVDPYGWTGQPTQDPLWRSIR